MTYATPAPIPLQTQRERGTDENGRSYEFDAQSLTVDGVSLGTTRSELLRDWGRPNASYREGDVQVLAYGDTTLHFNGESCRRIEGRTLNSNGYSLGRAGDDLARVRERLSRVASESNGSVEDVDQMARRSERKQGGDRPKCWEYPFFSSHAQVWRQGDELRFRLSSEAHHACGTATAKYFRNHTFVDYETLMRLRAKK